jgi:hypothetical protein
MAGIQNAPIQQAPIQQAPAEWLVTIRRYLGVTLIANLIWEIVQLPLYTLWTTGTVRQQAFAIVHCTIGDAMIAALCLILALLVFAEPTWPTTSAVRVFSATLAIGIGYTIYSEWINTSVRGNWAYSPWMPIIPLLGTGLSPLLQWLVVPILAHRISLKRPRK